MGNPYVSEIRIMSFGFAPQGWALCNGQILPIQQNQALFSLIGTNFGGDGVRTFALPNLQGRAPLHMGSDHFGNIYNLGETGGEASHTLTLNETPAHTHALNASTGPADSPPPAGVQPGPTVTLAQAAAAGGATPAVSIYSTASANTTLSASAISQTGGQPHENRQPFLTLSFCIALQGIFPSRS
jgi:microcystin-dependent protein